MKTLIKILFLSMFWGSCGENLVEEVKERYDDGNPKLVYYYKKVNNNKRLIKEKEYNSSGENDLIREIFGWYDNGNIKNKKTMIGPFNDKFQSAMTCIEDYYENGNSKYYGCYIDDSNIPTTGFHEEYYENGKIKKLTCFFAGPMYGQENIYDENGNIIQEGFDLDKAYSYQCQFPYQRY